jgi:hypothetical protein
MPFRIRTLRLTFSAAWAFCKSSRLLQDCIADPMTQYASSPETKPQLLHLVFGGELKDLESHEFRDLATLDIVGIYPDYQSAYAAWKSAAQRSVDNAMMRYFVVHLHRLLEPNGLRPSPQPAPTP